MPRGTQLLKPKQEAVAPTILWVRLGGVLCDALPPSHSYDRSKVMKGLGKGSSMSPGGKSVVRSAVQHATLL
jgi:hypothetical protein